MEPESLNNLHLAPSSEDLALLRALPGVREAAFVLCESHTSGEEFLVAYIVPDDDYITRVLAGEDHERNRIQKWRKTFDLSQFGKQAEHSEPGFNIAGWNSSYTRQPIPPEHMREWVDLTVQELLCFSPREILEIGCGTGLLLLRMAPACERYVGTDFAAAVLKKLKNQIDEINGAGSNVTLHERSADNFDGFGENSFDTVILNSVVKYFPGPSYLLKVLQGALRVTKPGGRIFVGDVRNFALLEPYAASIELYQAPPAMSLGELRDRVHHRVRFEDQLVISPAFFLALRELFPKITRVEVHPKPGRFDNEMTRFRFNAILHLETEKESPLEFSFLDYLEQRFTLDSVSDLLQNKNTKSLAIKNIINARIENDLVAFSRLAVAEASATVSEFKTSLEQRALQGIDPQNLWALGEQLGYRADISWASSRTDGSYDAVFRKLRASHELSHTAMAWPQNPIDAKNLAHYANTPGRAVLREKLIEQLLEFSQKNIPQNSAPGSFFLVDALPLTADGKVDVHKLPAPPTPHS
jgi:ubiquinone/menaquinone biosynthesis C-methylase UbiE